MNGSVDLQILLFDVGNSFFHYLFVNMLAATLYMLCVTISAKEVMLAALFLLYVTSKIAFVVRKCRAQKEDVSWHSSSCALRQEETGRTYDSMCIKTLRRWDEDTDTAHIEHSVLKESESLWLKCFRNELKFQLGWNSKHENMRYMAVLSIFKYYLNDSQECLCLNNLITLTCKM